MNHHEWIPSENTPRRHCRHCGIYEDYTNKCPTCEPQEKTGLAIICREEDAKTGRIAVYEIQAPVTDSLLAKLSVRSRMNMELKYYAVPRVRWESKWGEDYKEVLQRKELTPEALRLIGGIVEI